MRYLKGWTAFSFLVLAVLCIALAAFAQEAPPTPPMAGSPLDALIPFVVPVALALLKHFMGRVPAWLLPVLAPILGAGADILIFYGSGQQTGFNPVLGAMLGSAGVGVREAVDQAKSRIKDGPKDSGPDPPGYAGEVLKGAG